jgi:competence protein ComEC
MAVVQAPALERRQTTRGDVNVWQTPLVPIAAALTAGIVFDRYAQPSLALSLAAAAASLLAWLLHRPSQQHVLALWYLWLAVAALGCAYHHEVRYRLDPDDISQAAATEALPSRLRGWVASSPRHQTEAAPEPLRNFPSQATTSFVLRATGRQDLGSRLWLPATGLIQVRVVGIRSDLGVGAEVEVLGRLGLPEDPANPGEFDYPGYLRDQQVTALLTVLDSNSLEVLDRKSPRSLAGGLAVMRGWGQRILAGALPAAQQALAEALLLGEDASVSRADWDIYQRTGVLHVLAISGQHLTVLGGFLWLLARAVGVRRRGAAPAVALALLLYALLAGGRPPVMRAAWMVVAWCGAILLRRPVQIANLFALAWLGVALVNPTDLFSTGCQLSFLAVAILLWGTGRWQRAEPDPLRQLNDESRPWLMRQLLVCLRAMGWAYAVNAVVWLAVAPLIAARYHLIAPIALLLGPPLVLLTSIGLLAGFLLLLASWSGPLALPFAWATRWSLAGCDLLVHSASEAPGAYAYVADVPEWWLWIFYAALLLGLTAPLGTAWARLLLGAGLAWLGLGVALQLWPHRPGEFRCSFLAVGHGGCTVLETPGGRVLLYDAGAITGPDMTRRYIAPFLWQRGIRAIDEVVISHADLDHFNGLVELSERFRIGTVTSTPSFSQRDLPAVAHTLRQLDRRGIPLRSVEAGTSWQVDDVTCAVLHPPAAGPAGNENARSLVLLVAHRNLNLLLTGDLEGAGLERVLRLPAPRVDVLMAPHHGSAHSDPARLATWAEPHWVVSCQKRPLAPQGTARVYEAKGAAYLATWLHGTVTVHQDDRAAWIETYRSGLRQALR